MVDRPVSDGSGGGRRGRWLGVLALWTRSFVFSGLIKCLGLMIPTLQEQFQTTASLLGGLTAQISVVAGLFGPLVKPITRPFQPGFVFMVCGVMVSASLILASLSTSPIHIAIALAPLSGLSSVTSSIVLKEVIARDFGENYGTAVSLGYTGSPCGLIVPPLLVQFFLGTYGWRGTMLLLGALFLHLSVCGALMITTWQHSGASGYQRIAQVPASLPPQESSGCGRSVFFADMNFALLASGGYWAVAILRCFSMLPYSLWLIYFVSMAESIGLSIEEATAIVTVAGVASLLGKLGQGFLIDRHLVPQWLLLGACAALVALAFGSSPWLTYWPLMLASVAIVVGNGFIFCATDVVIRDVLGVENLAGVYGWIGLTTALLDVTLGFFPGWVYDVTGSFAIAFLVIGGFQASTLVPLLLLKYFQCIH